MYPIKVNQHRSVAGTLASNMGEGFGLEAGSKPELMAVMALSRPGGLIVCNGYKDREYIRLALIGRKQIDRGTPPVPEEAIAGVKQDIATVSERAHR